MYAGGEGDVDRYGGGGVAGGDTGDYDCVVAGGVLGGYSGVARWSWSLCCPCGAESCREVLVLFAERKRTEVWRCR